MERKLENIGQQIKLKQIGESKRKYWIKWSGGNKIRNIGKGGKEMFRKCHVYSAGGVHQLRTMVYQVSMETPDTVHTTASEFKAKSDISDRNDTSCCNAHCQGTQLKCNI
jgi:hypothetical protein